MTPPHLQNPSRDGAAAVLNTGEMDSGLLPPAQGNGAASNSVTQVHAAQAAFAAQSRAGATANAGPGRGAQFAVAEAADLGMAGERMNSAELAPPDQNQPRSRRRHIDNITLVDIAQCFHLPIREASKTLKIGVTMLKTKCRKYGIPRWPHRKIKSLDSLIHDLEYVLADKSREDAELELMEMEEQMEIEALARRKRMLESEKETIRQKPTLDLMSETKQFRQYVFKRKHKAKNEARV